MPDSRTLNFNDYCEKGSVKLMTLTKHWREHYCFCIPIPIFFIFSSNVVRLRLSSWAALLLTPPACSRDTYVMTDGGLIHRLVCKKTSLSPFSEQFLAVLNLKYLRRILRSENDRLVTSPQHPIPAFCSDHTRTRLTAVRCRLSSSRSASTNGLWRVVVRVLASKDRRCRSIWSSPRVTWGRCKPTRSASRSKETSSGWPWP